MREKTLFKGHAVTLQAVPLRDHFQTQTPLANHESHFASCFGHIGILSLCRGDRANAFDSRMMEELLETVKIIREHSGDTPDHPAPRDDSGHGDHRHPQEPVNLRVVVVHGQGSHFCAGADLGWMRQAAQLSFDENIADAGLLQRLFAEFKNIPVPTLGLIHGSIMGGGVGLVACMDMVIACDDSKFSLSEVKLGLAPAVILPYLKAKMAPGFLRQYALTGQVFSAQRAFENGLVQEVVRAEDKFPALVRILEQVLMGSPQAQRALKNYLNQNEGLSLKQGPTAFESIWTPVTLIAHLRTSEEGQKGLHAFFQKAPAPWRPDSSWKETLTQMIQQV